MERVQGGLHTFEEDEDGLSDLPQLTAEHLKIQRRLSPLFQVESALIKQLSPLGLPKAEDSLVQDRTERSSLKEVAVNSATQWRDRFGRLVKGGRLAASGEEEIDECDPDDSGRLLHACAEDMVKLWNDPVIQELLHKLKIRMEEHAGLYVPHISTTSQLIQVL